MLKKEIRKIYQQKRIQLPFEEMQEKTMLMNFRFNNMNLPAIAYALSYNPLPDKNEFDISGCQEIIKLKFPNVKIAFPKTSADHLHMEARILNDQNMFVKNRYNILEPLDGELLPASLLDLVFIPMLAFDQKGYRVGYGKGFYDYFLSGCRSDAVKIGFSFFDPLDQIADINEFDVPLNLCITPMRIYEFQ